MTAKKGPNLGDIVIYKFSDAVSRPGIVIGVNADGSANVRIFTDPHADGQFFQGAILMRGTFFANNIDGGDAIGQWSTP